MLSTPVIFIWESPQAFYPPPPPPGILSLPPGIWVVGTVQRSIMKENYNVSGNKQEDLTPLPSLPFFSLLIHMLVFSCPQPRNLPYSLNVWNGVTWWEQGWHIGVSVASYQCGPNSIPKFGIMWVEFFVGSYPCSEGFLWASGFSSLLKNQHC